MQNVFSDINIDISHSCGNGCCSNNSMLHGISVDDVNKVLLKHGKSDGDTPFVSALLGM